MKGALNRWRQRQLEKSQHRTMQLYESTLKAISSAGSGNGIPAETSAELNRTIRVGEVYAIRCNDRPEYYVTFQIKENPFNSGYVARFSNVVYGLTPPGIPETTEANAFKRIRELNASTTTTSGSLQAFPFVPYWEGKS